jgi:hypothetical protein
VFGAEEGLRSTRFPAGTQTCSAKVPWCLSDRRVRRGVQRLVLHAVAALAGGEDRVDDDGTAVLVGACGVGAEHHGEPVHREPHPAQDQTSWWVDGDRLHVHAHPSGWGFHREVPEPETRQRIGVMELLDPGTAHHGTSLGAGNGTGHPEGWPVIVSAQALGRLPWFAALPLRPWRFRPRLLMVCSFRERLVSSGRPILAGGASELRTALGPQQP